LSQLKQFNIAAARAYLFLLHVKCSLIYDTINIPRCFAQIRRYFCCFHNPALLDVHSETKKKTKKKQDKFIDAVSLVRRYSDYFKRLLNSFVRMSLCILKSEAQNRYNSILYLQIHVY
jgi:hypothetical protein